MIRLLALWCVISSIALSFGVDTIVVHQMNNNYNISGQIPRFSAQDKDDEKLTTFLKEINDDIDYEYSEIKGEVISEALQFSHDFPNSNLLPFTLNTTYTITSNSAATVYSVVIETTYYTGGAHANYSYKGYTLDNFRRYELEDFFKDPEGAYKYMVKSIENSIYNNIQKSKLGLESLKYFDGVEVNLTDAVYYVSGNNIVLLFPHYILGPYSSGEIEFVFSFQELRPFLYKKLTEV